MADFDPEEFEDKYANYFPELQEAYKSVFERMNDTYDSELIHAIDQSVLAESEPFYEPPEGDAPPEAGTFRLELPENPAGRVASTGVFVEEEKLESVLSEYVEEIEAELRAVFEFEGTESGDTESGDAESGDAEREN